MPPRLPPARYINPLKRYELRCGGCGVDYGVLGYFAFENVALDQARVWEIRKHHTKITVHDRMAAIPNRCGHNRWCYLIDCLCVCHQDE